MKKKCKGILFILITFFILGLFVISSCSVIRKGAIGRNMPLNQQTYTLTANPTSGNAPLAVSFSVSGGDFPINAYFRWHFGNYIYTSSTSVIGYTYSVVGNYSAYVEVLGTGNQIFGTSNIVLIVVNPPPPTNLLTVTKTGTGQGTVTSNPGGIYCGNDCTQTYAMGTSVVLTATPYSNGSTFVGWSGDCTGTGTCSVTINSNKNVNAIFDLQPCYDSDGGKNYYVKGFAQNPVNLPLWDICSDWYGIQNAAVEEQYCTIDQQIYFQKVRCPYNCENDICKKTKVAIIEFQLEDTQYVNFLDYEFLDVVNNQVGVMYIPEFPQNVHSYYFFDDWYDNHSLEYNLVSSINLTILGPYIINQMPPVGCDSYLEMINLRTFFENQAAQFIDINLYDYIIYIYFDDRWINPAHSGGFLSCADIANNSTYIDQFTSTYELYDEHHLEKILHEFGHLLGASDHYAAINNQYQCTPAGYSGIVGKACLMCGMTKIEENGIYMYGVNDVDNIIICQATLEEFGWI